MKLTLFFVVVILKLQFYTGVRIGSVRLVGSQDSSEGRVEVFYNQTWGTVYDDLWDLRDASVVCRSLKLEKATSAPFSAAFGPGSGPIWMDDIKCFGSESSLLECPHSGLGSHNCRHNEDASAVCGYPPLRKFTITNRTGMITSPGYPKAMQRANYEWTFKIPGRDWLAALYFEEIDLKRINFGKSALFVKNSRNVTVLTIVNQKRKENSGWIVKDLWKIGFYSLFTIMHGNGHGGKGMRLRYFILKQHSCNPNWSINVSAGVGAINVSWDSLSQNKDYMYLVMYNNTQKDPRNFLMVTSSTSLRIRYLLTDTVYSIQLLGFYPSDVASGKYSCLKQIKTKKAHWRLAGGQSFNEGLIQVNYDDRWGTVCPIGWDIRDARVACRSLGYPPATYALTRAVQFSITKRKTWLSGIRCNGYENSILECPHGGWGNLQALCNRFLYTAGVVCGHPNVTRLDITQSFGVITSPGYPRYMVQAHYEWTFRPPSARAGIVVYFETINLNSREVGVNNLTVIGPDGNQLFFVQNQKKPMFSYLSWKSPLKVILYSSLTTGTHGRGFRMFYLILNEKLTNVPIYPSWNITANSTRPHSIMVTWSEFNEKDLTVVAYLITCNATKRQNGVFYSIVNKTSSPFISIDNLMGYVQYRVQAFAYLRNVSTGIIHMYGSAARDLKTPEGVPTRSPPNITVTLQYQRVIVKWSAIPQEHVHGVLLGYNVFYQNTLHMKEKNTITTTNSYVVLMDLLPGMYYRLQVAGFTAKGQGTTKYLSFLTKCGDVIEPDERVGTILMPNISTRYWVMDCEWTLKPQYKGALLVVMVGMENFMPWYFPCRKLYIALINGKNRMSDKFCGQRQVVSIVSYGSAKVHFYSSGAWPLKRGSLLKATYYILKNGFDEVSLYSDWKITVTHHYSSTINIQWDMLQKFKGKPVNFIAVCISKADETQVYGAATNSNATRVQVENLKPYSDYSVRVFAFIGNFFNIDWQKGILKSQMVSVRTLKKDWNPRFPSRHDIINSVRIVVKGLDVLQWNQLYDFKFKKTVAHEVTLFCSKEKRCPTPVGKRLRRASPYIFVFTSEQVHLLPGYPVQMAYSGRNPNKMLAAVTFYVRFPPDSGIKSNESLSQALLMDAVKTSVSSISKAINKTVLSISEHRMFPTTAPPKAQQSVAGVAAGSVVAVVISIIVIATIIIVARKYYVPKQGDEQPVIELQNPEVENEPPEGEGPLETPGQKQEVGEQEEPNEKTVQDSFGLGNQGIDIEI